MRWCNQITSAADLLVLSSPVCRSSSQQKLINTSILLLGPAKNPELPGCQDYLLWEGGAEASAA